MNAKKLLSASLACALALSLSVPAFAADDKEVTAPDSTTGLYTSGDITIEGEVKTPVVKVTLPAAGSVVINPYKMEVTLGSAKVKDQIVSAPQFIKNGSNVPISIDATVTGEAAGNAVFATAAWAEGKAPTTNSVFMYLEVLPATDGSTVPSWATAFDKTKHVVAAHNKAATLKDIVTLKAATYGADGTMTADSESFAAFHLAGIVSENPTKAWTAADKVSAKIVFTFNPAIEAPAT